MKKIMILLAGYPATGKTYLCNQILNKYPQFQVISQDELKEKLWEQYGFDTMEEKEELERQAWSQYYQNMEEMMQDTEWIISDYPFSEKQKDKLYNLSTEYQYHVITIRLTGDIDILYQRSLKRDLDPKRHLAHLVSKYHAGDTMEDRNKADGLVTYDIFKERCLTRGYDKFQLGDLIEVDATDYNKISYEKILQQIENFI